MKKTPSTRVLIATAIGTGALALITARSVDRSMGVSMPGPGIAIVNERGFWSGLLGIDPDPIADCGELSEWLAEHPTAFHAHVERPAFTAELQYRPAACMACLEKPGATFADPWLKERVKALGTTELFVLRLSPGTGKRELPEITDALQMDIVEVAGTDTVPCAFLHAEPLPPGVPYRSVLLGFDRPQDASDRRVVLRDRRGELGGDLVLALPAGAATAYTQALNPQNTR